MKKKIVSTMLIMFIQFGITVSTFAKDSLTFAIANPPPKPTETVAKSITPMSHLEFSLSLIVLAFGILVIILEMILIKNRRISPEDTIKFIIITLIITSTLFLITAGYSNDQIAPAVGLLGTIAGYLLGKIQNAHTNVNQNEAEK